MSTDTPRTEVIAQRFIAEISDGWGEDVEKKDVQRLVELFSPIERELAAEQEKVKRLREALALALRYGITEQDLDDAHLCDKSAPIYVVVDARAI